MDLFIGEGIIPIQENRFVSLETTIVANRGQRNIYISGNGTGKTTLFRWLSGQLEKEKALDSSLNLLINGNITTPPINHVAAFVPQSTKDGLFGLPVYDELQTAFRTLDYDLLSTLIDRLELKPFLNRLSFELSDGERMRVVLATAIATYQDWLVLDEWESHLDAMWRRTIQGLLNGMCSEVNLGIIEFTSNLNNASDSCHQLVLSVKPRQRADHQFTDNLEKFFSENLICSTNFSITHSGKLRNGGFRKTINSVTFFSGTISAIIGKNGSGKTTFIRSLLKDEMAKKFRKDVCVIFSDPGIQLRVVALNQLLSEFISNGDNLEELCESILGVDGDINSWNLSFGQKKLLAVIVGILSNKKILAIDEAFSGLDYFSILVMASMLNYAAKNLGKCIIITAQDELYISGVELDQAVEIR